MDRVAEWRIRTIIAAFVPLAVAVGSLFATGDTQTLHDAQTQDVFVIVPLCAAAILSLFWSPGLRLPQKLPSWWMLLAGAIVVAGLLGWGAYAVFSNYPQSRDEHMVLFDMAVFETARLAVPLDAFWRPYARALIPDFLLNPTMPTGLVSSYLPLNAVLRLLFSKIADPAWFNPLLAVVGGVALIDIARRIFGHDARACWVALLIYGLSAQMLVTAMTPFAMTGHMALNLVWLAAFLRGGKGGHAAAILTGFLATGLHQLVFHPFFVVPFLLWRLREGNWRLVLTYAAAYAVIMLWWAAYPMLAAAQAASATGAPSNDNLAERLLQLLMHRTPGTAGLMVLNLVRFVAWQNFALLPLLVAAVPVALRERGLPGAMLLGIVLWLALVTLILPYQGLGWGFRYLSGYLGSFALLGAYGFRDLEQRIGSRADGLVIGLSGLTLAIAIPTLLVTTHRFTEPYVLLDRFIERQPTPLVLIDTEVTHPLDRGWSTHPFSQVRNLPDLSNRPLRFSSNQLDPELLARLCGKGPVTLITRNDMHRIGFEANVPLPSPQFDDLISSTAAKVPGCFRPAM